jgi:hypothetical protein
VKCVTVSSVCSSTSRTCLGVHCSTADLKQMN